MVLLVDARCTLGRVYCEKRVTLRIIHLLLCCWRHRVSTFHCNARRPSRPISQSVIGDICTESYYAIGKHYNQTFCNQFSKYKLPRALEIDLQRDTVVFPEGCVLNRSCNAGRSPKRKTLVRRIEWTTESKSTTRGRCCLSFLRCIVFRDINRYTYFSCTVWRKSSNSLKWIQRFASADLHRKNGVNLEFRGMEPA